MSALVISALPFVVEDTELTSILEGVGMRQVPADEVFALDLAVRDTLIQAVRSGAEAIVAVHQLLEDLFQLAVFAHQVMADVFRRTHAEADLGLGVWRPGQAHMDRVLGQGDQRAQLPDFGGITLLGVGCSGGQCERAGRQQQRQIDSRVPSHSALHG